MTPRQLGAQLSAQGVRFSAFANAAKECSVRLFDEARIPLQTLQLQACGDGYFTRDVPGVGVGALYKLLVDGLELPDPYARRFCSSQITTPSWAPKSRPAEGVSSRASRPLQTPRFRPPFPTLKAATRSSAAS